MNDSELEKKIKEEADNIKMKSFEERWQTLEKRMALSERITVDVTEPVLATAEGGVEAGKKVNLKLLIEILAPILLFLVLLAIILPSILRRNDEPRFLDLKDLNEVSVTEEEFSIKIENSELNVINLSSYELNFCYIFLFEENVYGGRTEVYDENLGYALTLQFYNKLVVSKLEINDAMESYQFNGYDFKYQTKEEDGVYYTTALAANQSIRYEMEFMAGDGDILSKFNKLFG